MPASKKSSEPTVSEVIFDKATLHGLLEENRRKEPSKKLKRPVVNKLQIYLNRKSYDNGIGDLRCKTKDDGHELILITDKDLTPALSDFVARREEALAASRAEEEKRKEEEEKAAWFESLKTKENFDYDSESDLKPGNELDDGSRSDILQCEYSDYADADTLVSTELPNDKEKVVTTARNPAHFNFKMSAGSRVAYEARRYV